VGLATSADSSITVPGENSIDSNSTDVIARADELSLSHFHFRYDDKTVQPVSEGIDYSHLDIRDVSADVSNVFFQGETIAVDIIS
jgi:hypothetical protein